MSKIKISLLLLCLLLIFVIFLAYSNRHYVKSLAKKNPTVFSLFKKGKGFIDSNAPAWLVGKKKLREDVAQVEIVVDAGDILGKIEPFWGGFGYDFFYSGATQPKNRALFELIKEVNQERKTFNYYRAHNIFSDKDAPSGEESGGRVYSEDSSGNPVYDWTRVDAVFDVIVDAGMKPIVELGFMPEALTSDPGRIGDWRAANVAPPKNYTKWRNLVFETVKHLQERYGAAEIESWYFEVWNEPDLWHHFWIPDPKNSDKSHIDEYLKLYDYTVDGAVAANDKIKIGGPAIAGWADVFEKFLRHTKNGKNFVTGANGSRVDFISFHKYGYIEENIIHGIKYLMDVALAVDKDKFSTIPFLLDEMGPSTRSRDPWKNSPFVAAWMCKFVDAMFELEQTTGAAYRPDATIFWADVGVNFQEGEGMLATALKNDHETIIKGPVFTSYELLSLIEGDRIRLTGTEFGDFVHGFAARNGDTSIDLVLYKMNDYNPYYEKSTDVQLRVKNIPFDIYYVNYYLIDEQHSNAFHAWKKMGNPQKPTEEQIRILQSNDDLELAEAVSQGKTASSEFTKRFTMKSNSALLIKISKVSDFVDPQPPTKLVASKVTENEIHLFWKEPPKSEDGDVAEHYQIYRNEDLVKQTEAAGFVDTNLMDDTEYNYAIYSVDDQGNRCATPLQKSFKTKKDDVPPSITHFFMPDAKTMTIDFSEPLRREIASDKNNLSISSGIEIESVKLLNDGARLEISTAPHVIGFNYRLNLENMVDYAKIPNHVKTPVWKYRYTATFKDNFNRDTGENYTWTHEHSEGGFGQHAFDRAGRRLKVVSGDDVSEKFSHEVPASTAGTFSFSFLPLQKYPDGGTIVIRLLETESSYYQISNTDGYGAGKVEKFINEQVVAEKKFDREFSQNVTYTIGIHFSSDLIEVSGFGQRVILPTNTAGITVRKFEIILAQQNAYFDDINFEGK